MNANAINSIGGYFNSSGYLTEANGGTGTNLSAVPNGSILVQNTANVGIGTFGQGTSGQFVTSQGAGVNPTWSTYTPPTQMSAYNVTAPLITLFDNSTQVAASAIGLPLVTNRTSPFNRPGTVNFNFIFTTSGGAATGTAYIRKNGVQAGTTRNNSGASTVAYSENLTVAAGDYFELYVSACSNTCSINDFNVMVGNSVSEVAVASNNLTRLQPQWLFGSGAPNSSYISCNIGDLYSRTDGGATTTLYVCTTANNWTAK